MSSVYVSVLKLDGEHILPPVMTKARYEEMRVLRDLAIQVEKRLKEKREAMTLNNLPMCCPPEEEPPQITDYDLFDETATSETLETDRLPHPQDEQDPINCEPIPSQKVENPIPETVHSSPKLIRSNSYTLEQPSPQLQKYLDSSGDIPVAKVSAAKTSPRRLHSKSGHSTPKSPSHGNRRKTPRKLSDPSTLNRIYGLKTSPGRKQTKQESLDDTKRRLMIYSRGEKVEKFFMKAKTVKEFENLTRNKRTSRGSQDSSGHELITVTAPTHEENKENVDAVQLQSEDDKTMTRNESGEGEETLVNRPNHRMLMAKLEALNLMDRTSTPVQRMLSKEPESHLDHSVDSRLNETSFYSTIRGESPIPAIQCSMTLVSEAYSRQYEHSLRSFNLSPTPYSTVQRESEDIAATIINSHVRGYLVRRLLRSEFVQNIIDRIKEILFVILDANPNEIQLKRSYLMELNGNCERLHDVFFKFSTKERMQVIAKDREILLNRLNQRRAKLSVTAFKVATRT